MADGEMLSQWGLFCAETYENKPYYFPSVEAGKFYERGDRIILPLSVTCHHAATDGYHVKCFLDTLQSDVTGFEKYIL